MFILLQVNGIDVSQVSHEEAVHVFQSAPEPIQVEVVRRRDVSTDAGAKSKPAGKKPSSDVMIGF